MRDLDLSDPVMPEVFFEYFLVSKNSLAILSVEKKTYTVNSRPTK